MLMFLWHCLKEFYGFQELQGIKMSTSIVFGNHFQGAYLESNSQKPCLREAKGCKLLSIAENFRFLLLVPPSSLILQTLFQQPHTLKAHQSFNKCDLKNLSVCRQKPQFSEAHPSEHVTC